MTSRVIAPLGKGPDGTAGWISLFNLAGSANLLVDVEGWYADSTVPATMGSSFTPTDPCRAVDEQTIDWAGPEPRFDLFYACGIPLGSTAVVTTATTRGSSISLEPLFPQCARQALTYPDFAWAPGKKAAGLDQVALTNGPVMVGDLGSPSLARGGTGAVVSLLLDVAGYFTAGSARAPWICLVDDGGVHVSPEKSDLVTATVFDTVTGHVVPGDSLAFSVAPTPGSAGCRQTSLRTGSLLTDSHGAAVVGYDPPMHRICLITASDRRGASESVSRAADLLELAPPSGSSPIVVTATYYRSDGTPHAGGVLSFRVIVNSLGAAPVGHGSCITDQSGQCSFSYRLGISPAGYYGSTIVFVEDAVGLQAYESVPGGG